MLFRTRLLAGTAMITIAERTNAPDCAQDLMTASRDQILNSETMPRQGTY